MIQLKHILSFSSMKFFLVPDIQLSRFSYDLILKFHQIYMKIEEKLRKLKKIDFVAVSSHMKNAIVHGTYAR